MSKPLMAALALATLWVAPAHAAERARNRRQPQPAIDFPKPLGAQLGREVARKISDWQRQHSSRHSMTTPRNAVDRSAAMA